MKIKLIIERSPGQEDTPRSLEELCLHHKFELQLVGVHYCGLANTERVNCQYKATETDKNGLYLCTKHQTLFEFVQENFQMELELHDLATHQEDKGEEGTRYS